MSKNEYTDKELIEALRRGGTDRDKAWEYMYKNWSGAWVRVVCDLGGNPEEARGALHEVAMKVQKVLCNPEFQLTAATLKTYIVSCVRNRWQREHRKQTREPSNSNREENQMEKVIRDTVDSVEKQVMKVELRQAVDKLLSVLSERCRRVLSSFSQGYSLREIAAAEDWKDADKAKKEKYECQEKLKKYLRDNPEIEQQLKDLLNG